MSKPTDPDLMLLADGGLADGEAGALERAAGPTGAAKLAALREVGELVRGHLELAADAAEPRLAGLWDLVERRLDADPAAAPAPAAAATAAPAPRGPWRRFSQWLDAHRGHVLTGALSAGAVAAVAIMLRAEPRVEYREVAVPVRADGGAAVPVGGDGGVAGPVVVVAATPPEVESLEVSGGTGTVFTVEDEDGGPDTAVIWVTPDDILEGI